MPGHLSRETDDLRANGFTLVEVSVATLLVCIGLASIVAIHGQSIHLLRSTRQASAASNILQQRIDHLRTQQWLEISTSAGLRRVLSRATDSESELPADTITEVVSVAPVQPSEVGPVTGAAGFRVRRADRSAAIEVEGDLSSEQTLLFTSTVTWQDPKGQKERTMRSIICRAGLTRSGIVGSGLGRPKLAAP